MSPVDLVADAAWFAQMPGNWQWRPRDAKLSSRAFAALASGHNFARGKRNGNPWGEALALLRTPSGQPASNLTQVTDSAKCSQVENGWYYDDAAKPSRIILCPTMCGTANASPGTKIEALVGCQAPAPR